MKILNWIKTTGTKTFAAIMILTIGLLMFVSSAVFRADNNVTMNVVIEEIGYLGTSLEYPEVRDRIEIQQNKLAALSAKSERYNIISFGGAAMLWAGLTMLITQISVWMFLKLPGTRSAVVGADGKLSEDEQTNYMKLIGTVYAVAGISIASIMIGGGVL